MRNFLLFSVNERRYALPLAAVRRVIRMVDVTPLPDAPPPVTGVVNWGGEIVPVLDIRTVAGGATRPHSPSDHLLFAEAQGRTVALAVDSAEGVLPLPDEDTASLGGVLQGTGMSEEIAAVAGEMVLIWDLGRFLAGTGIVREAPGEFAP